MGEPLGRGDKPEPRSGSLKGRIVFKGGKSFFVRYKKRVRSGDNFACPFCELEVKRKRGLVNHNAACKIYASVHRR